MKNVNYDGYGILHPIFAKRCLINYLEESAFCVVKEFKEEIIYTKNRYGNRTMSACKEIDFEKVKLSELNGTINEIHNKYYGRNIWLLMEQ